MDDGNNGLGNSYTTESPDDHDKGIGMTMTEMATSTTVMMAIKESVTHHPTTGRSNYHQYVALITIG